MLAQSPLIENGDLVLLPTGQLQYSADIVTEMTVSVAAYNCIYNSQVNSQLIPYLSGFPIGGRNINAITNIVAASFQRLINAKLISNLQISVIPVSTSYVTINISATDIENNPITLNWSNV